VQQNSTKPIGENTVFGGMMQARADDGEGEEEEEELQVQGDPA
jgi:hypothetical protein